MNIYKVTLSHKKSIYYLCKLQLNNLLQMRKNT